MKIVFVVFIVGSVLFLNTRCDTPKEVISDVVVEPVLVDESVNTQPPAPVNEIPPVEKKTKVYEGPPISLGTKEIKEKRVPSQEVINQRIKQD